MLTSGYTLEVDELGSCFCRGGYEPPESPRMFLPRLRSQVLHLMCKLNKYFIN